MDFEQTLMLGHKLLVCTKSSKLTHERFNKSENQNQKSVQFEVISSIIKVLQRLASFI